MHLQGRIDEIFRFCKGDLKLDDVYFDFTLEITDIMYFFLGRKEKKSLVILPQKIKTIFILQITDQQKLVVIGPTIFGATKYEIRRRA